MHQWPQMAIHPPTLGSWKLSQATIRFFTEVLHVKPLLTLDDWTQLCQVLSGPGDGPRCFPGARFKKKSIIKVGGVVNIPLFNSDRFGI